MVHFIGVHCCLPSILWKSKKVWPSGAVMKTNLKHNTVRILEEKAFWVQIPHFIVRNAKLAIYFDHVYDSYDKMFNEIKKEVWSSSSDSSSGRNLPIY